jgi:hypothetical protein
MNPGIVRATKGRPPSFLLTCDCWTGLRRRIAALWLPAVSVISTILILQFLFSTTALPDVLANGASQATNSTLATGKLKNTLGDAVPPEKKGSSAGGTAQAGPDCCLHPRVSRCRTLALAIVLCVAYWFATVVVRWNRIARPTRELLRAQIKSMRDELVPLKIPANHITPLLDAASLLIKEDAGDPPEAAPVPSARVKLANFLFWSRGQELTGWGYVHEAEMEIVSFLPEDTVSVRLESEEQALRLSDDAAALALANTIQRERAVTPPITSGRQRALLEQALEANRGREDNSYADLVSWQNKTSWLVALGLLLIAVLSGEDPDRGIFFLVGAVGGLLSRLGRSLDRKDLPTDYGASWTTLFLSPVAGALGAWGAIVLSALAVKLNVLNENFANLWEQPLSHLALGVALLFGFSERLFDEVLDKLDDKTSQNQSSTKTAPLPAKTSSIPSTVPASPQKLPDAIVGQTYTGQLTASVGAPVAWALKADTPPTGLTIQQDGTFAGMAAADANGKTFQFTATATGPQSAQDVRFAITVKANP